MNVSLWKSWVLRAAGVYNLVWGCLAVLFPLAFFRAAGMADPNYPELWQCIGMFVAVWGVGYLITSTDPNRYWPVVLVGLLGKILGPIGFVQAALAGRIPWKAGWTIVTNDLIWLVPFGLILHGAYGSHLGGARRRSPEVVRLGLRARTQHGMALDEMSRRWPTLVVFLRHFGCTFCREALADLAAQRSTIESNGVRIALVHMSSDEDAAAFFSHYQMHDVARISDPDQAVYRAFGLSRGTLSALFGPSNWVRGFEAGVVRGHGVGMLAGDGFQMPGVFLLFHGEILRTYVHQSASDRPDYAELASPVSHPELA